MTPQTKRDWHANLPSINEEKRDTDKLQIRGRFKHAPTNTYFYVAQGRFAVSYWEYWGFAVVPGRKFAFQLTVSSHDLKTGVWLGQVPLKLDEEFQPGSWLAIKNAHFPPTGPISAGRAHGRGNGSMTHPHVLQ